MNLFKLSIIVGLLSIVAMVAVENIGYDSCFLFEPEVLKNVASKAIEKHGGDVPKMVDFIKTELHKKYPGHVNLKEEWVFNNAGGAMGSMFVLHASLTEYVIIFGSPIGTSGHTGRFFATDYFMILDGEQLAFDEDQTEAQHYLPGEMHVLPLGHAQAYRIPERCYALEYARGNIIAMLPFGLF